MKENINSMLQGQGVEEDTKNVSSSNVEGTILSGELRLRMADKGLFYRCFSEEISTAIVCIDVNHRITHFNRAFLSVALLEGYVDTPGDQVLTRDFYEFLDFPEIKGPDFCPFATVKKTRRMTETTVKLKNETYDLKISPLCEEDGSRLVAYLVEMIDSTKYVTLEEKLDRLQNVGHKLSDLTKQDIQQISEKERYELLKSRILTYFKETFDNYSIFEFRLLDKATNKLIPFISEGLSPEARDREIYAEGTGNGTTGHAAHFKHVYICDDPMADTLFMPSSSRVLSAISIPMTCQGEVLGTCNVESHDPYAFNERDGYLLQLFVREVATALHTFELLTHEGQKASLESILKVQNAISLPTDEIVRASSSLLDETSKQRNILGSTLQTIAAYLDNSCGQNADPKEMLRVISDSLQSQKKYFEDAEKQVRTVLSTSRDMKEQITSERKRLDQLQELGQFCNYPLLKKRRVLVLDKDLQVLKNAHEVLEKYDCIVETATDALTALQMIRSTPYDLILSERKPLGGMNAEQFMIRLFDLFPNQKVVPLLMSIEQGVYDPDHILPKAMERGLLGYISRSPIYPKQLIPLFEKVLNVCGARDEAGNLLMAEGSQDDITDIDDGNSIEDGSSLSGSTSRIHGFLFQKGAKRFDEWASQFYKDIPSPENSQEEIDSKDSPRSGSTNNPSDPGSKNTPYDAT